MRATYVPARAAAERGAAGGVWLVVTTRGDASDGELLQQWAAAARDGRGELVVGD
jgi:hypothetical protein